MTYHKDIEDLNISIPVQTDFSEIDFSTITEDPVISISVLLNDDNYKIESIKFYDSDPAAGALATPSMNQPNTHTKKFINLTVDHLNDRDKLKNIKLMLEHKDNKNQIEYTLNTETNHYFVDTGTNCNQDALLERLNCYNTTISTIRNSDNISSIIHNNIDSNKINKMYFYHHQKPNSATTTYTDCMDDTTDHCSTSTSSSESSSIPKNLSELKIKRDELFKYRGYGLNDDILYKSLGIMFARMEINNEADLNTSKLDIFLKDEHDSFKKNIIYGRTFEYCKQGKSNDLRDIYPTLKTVPEHHHINGCKLYIEGGENIKFRKIYQMIKKQIFFEVFRFMTEKEKTTLMIDNLLSYRFIKFFD